MDCQVLLSVAESVSKAPPDLPPASRGHRAPWTCGSAGSTSDSRAAHLRFGDTASSCAWTALSCSRSSSSPSTSERPRHNLCPGGVEASSLETAGRGASLRSSSKRPCRQDAERSPRTVGNSLGIQKGGSRRGADSGTCSYELLGEARTLLGEALTQLLVLWGRDRFWQSDRQCEWATQTCKANSPKAEHGDVSSLVPAGRARRSRPQTRRQRTQ